MEQSNAIAAADNKIISPTTRQPFFGGMVGPCKELDDSVTSKEDEGFCLEPETGIGTGSGTAVLACSLVVILFFLLPF